MARTIRIIFLVFTLFVNALDFASDWLFYVSTTKVENGLVYGPVDSHQVTALLVFSIIGTVGFVVEIGVFIFELRKGEDFHGDFLLDLISAIFIWIEDIPQILISFSIALCREEAVSIFQLTKAGLVLIGVVVSIIATIIRFCRKFESKKGVCGVRLCLFIGILLEGAFAAAIFYLTQTEPDNNGGVSFKVPTTVIEDHLSDHRYLSDVSMFVHHSDFYDARNLDGIKKDSALNWIRLFPLYDLKNNKYLSFKLNYEYLGIQVLNLAIWTATNLNMTTFKWTLSECYTLNQDSAELVLVSNLTCPNEGFLSNRSRTYFIDFRFEEPDNTLCLRKRVFGEIFFNIKILKAGICSDGSLDDPLSNSAALYSPLTLHYFRINNPQEDSLKHMYRDWYNITRFFHKNSKEITDVAETWKTGWNQCASTGSMAPILDSNMQIRCH